MITIYKSELSGKDFNSFSDLQKHENGLKIVKRCFERLVECNFFSRCNIKPYFHNIQISTLHQPLKSAWRYHLSGYYLMHGRMGNPDDVVRLKIRNEHLLILTGTPDGDFNPMRYLLKLPLWWFNQDALDLQSNLDTFLAEYNEKPKAQKRALEEKRQQGKKLFEELPEDSQLAIKLYLNS